MAVSITVMYTVAANAGDAILDDATVPTDIERSCSKGLYLQALRVSIAFSLAPFPLNINQYP